MAPLIVVMAMKTSDVVLGSCAREPDKNLDNKVQILLISTRRKTEGYQAV